MRVPIACCITLMVAALVAGCGRSGSPAEGAGGSSGVREGTLQILSLNRLQGMGDSIPCQPGSIATLAAAAELRDRLAAEGSRTLLVAIGDSINRSYKPLHGKAAELTNLASGHVSLEALAAAMPDAYVPGHADLALGFDDVLSRCDALHVPVLLSNLVAPAHPGIKPWIVVQAGTLKVGLIGVIAGKVADTEAAPDEGSHQAATTDMSYPGASLLAVSETVERLVAELRQRQNVDLVVLLSSLSQKTNTRLSSIAGLDLVIGSTDASIDAEGVIIDKNTAIMSSASAGREVGQTTISIRNGNMQMADLSPVHLLRKQVPGVEQRLADYAERFGSDDPAVLARLVAPGDEQGFLNMVSMLQENKEFIEQSESWANSFLDHKPAELLPPRPDHPVLAVQARRGPAIEAALAAAELKPLAPHEGKSIIPAPDDCKSCHAAQFAFWQGTAHSHAAESLKAGSHLHDVSCLECHAAGYEDPNGWFDPRFDAPLGGVTCYQCHKVFALHGGSARQVIDPQFVQSDPEQMACTECHGERRSPGFDKERTLASVSCPPMRPDEPALLLARQGALDVIRNRREKGLADARDDYLEGRALLGLGSVAEGTALLEKFALANSEDPSLRVEIAALLDRTGNSKGALELLRKYLEAFQGEPLVNLEYVTLLLEATDPAARDPQLALSHLGFLFPKEAADSRKAALDFRVLLIDALFATGQPAKGLALINELSHDHANDPRLKARIARYVDR